MKNADDLWVNDIIYIANKKLYRKVTEVRTFREIWQVTEAVASAASLDGKPVINLDSGEDLIYVTGLEILHNIEVTALNFRDKNLLGAAGTALGTVEQNKYPEGIPYPLCQWMFNKEPAISIKNNHSASIAANTNVVAFTGLRFVLEAIDKPEEGKYTSINA